MGRGRTRRKKEAVVVDWNSTRIANKNEQWTIQSIYSPCVNTDCGFRHNTGWESNCSDSALQCGSSPWNAPLPFQAIQQKWKTRATPASAFCRGRNIKAAIRLVHKSIKLVFRPASLSTFGIHYLLQWYRRNFSKYNLSCHSAGAIKGRDVQLLKCWPSVV